MKKYMLILFISTLLFSCNKEKCWVLNDCIGNDIGKYCGSESDVQAYCQANALPGCAWGYRSE